MKTLLIKALNSTSTGEIKLEGNTLKINDNCIKAQFKLSFDREFSHQSIRDWAQIYRNASENLGFDEFEAVALLVSELSTKDKEELLILLGNED